LLKVSSWGLVHSSLASNTPYVDVAGARMLKRLHDELGGKNIGFRVVGAHSEVRDQLRYEKLQDWVGPINRHASLGQAVAMEDGMKDEVEKRKDEPESKS
jgi:hypothetical protein